MQNLKEDRFQIEELEIIFVKNVFFSETRQGDFTIACLKII